LRLIATTTARKPHSKTTPPMIIPTNAPTDSPDLADRLITLPKLLMLSDDAMVGDAELITEIILVGGV
jgi:hypothetical protein